MRWTDDLSYRNQSYRAFAIRHAKVEAMAASDRGAGRQAGRQAESWLRNKGIRERAAPAAFASCRIIPVMFYLYSRILAPALMFIRYVKHIWCYRLGSVEIVMKLMVRYVNICDSSRFITRILY
jgi:hypothetical protein